MAKDDTSYQSPKYTKFADKETEGDYIYWEDWLKRWENLRNPAEMISWLHIIFDTSAEVRGSSGSGSFRRISRDRIILCLEIAKECWKCRGMNDSHPDWDVVGRREVILKAISLLSTNWFNIGSGRSDELYSWFRDKGRLLINEDVLPEILAVFKEGLYSGYRIPSAAKEHEKVILKKFLTFLALLPWTGERQIEELLTEDQKAHLRLMEPELIRLLVDLGEVNQLISRRASLSRDNLRILRKIVFQSPFRGAKTASCIGEAIGLHLRDKTAETLLILEESINFADRLRRKAEHSRRKLNRLVEREEALGFEIQETEAAIAVARRAKEPTARLESMKDNLFNQHSVLNRRIRMIRKDLDKINYY